MLVVLFEKYGLKGAWKIFKEDILFDFLHRTNTAMPVNQQRLFGPGEHKNQNRYVASTFHLLESVFEFSQTQVNLDECGFVDLGSGKGKALIAASNYPFKSIKGIDSSKTMHNIAGKNLKRLKLDSQVQLILDSAAHIELLPHERVVYFFNSFTGEILEDCLQAIKHSPRHGIGVLIYANPTEDAHVRQHFPLIKSKILEPGSCDVNYYRLPDNT